MPQLATGVVSIANEVLTNVAAIAAGMDYSLALKKDGTVIGWGNNWRARALGFETSGVRSTNGLVIVDGKVLSNVVALCANSQRIALSRDGFAETWGFDSSGPTGRPFPGPHSVGGVAAIATGGEYALVLRKDGSLWRWGPDHSPPAALDDVIAIAVSSSEDGHGLALRSNRTVYAWGLMHDSVSQVEGATNVVAIAAGIEHYIALKSDGTVCEWGDYNPPIAVSIMAGEPAENLSSQLAVVGGKF